MARKDAATLAVETIADTAIADLDTLLRNLDAAIARALAKLATDDGGRLKPRNELGNLTTVRGQVLRALEAAGGKAVDTLDRRTLQAAERAASLADVPDEFLPDASSAIREIVRGRTREIARAFDAERSEVIAAINAGVAGGQSLDVLVGRVAERGQVAVSRAKSLVDTAVMACGRAVVVDGVANANEDAGEDLFLLRYVGPDDAKTRPFCRSLIGHVYSLDEIAKLDNGQTPDVATTCGGVNCRHGWAPIMLDEARRRGFRIVGA